MDRVSSSENSQSENEAARPATFEETYPRYEFAEMVRIGLVLSEWLAAGSLERTRHATCLRGTRPGARRMAGRRRRMAG